MKKLTTLLCFITLLASSASALAEQQAKNFEFMFAGAGKSARTFDDNDGGISAQLGFFLTKSFELGIRQYAFINSDNGSTSVVAASGLFADYHLDLGEFQPFLGIGGVFNYGGGVQQNFDIGPEIGFKYFVLPKTFIAAQGSYMRRADDIGSGNRSYGLFNLGVGFDF
jgi:hypothetical protein